MYFDKTGTREYRQHGIDCLIFSPWWFPSSAGHFCEIMAEAHGAHDEGAVVENEDEERDENREMEAGEEGEESNEGGGEDDEDGHDNGKQKSRPQRPDIFQLDSPLSELLNPPVGSKDLEQMFET
jgi:hypothetical protein